MFGIDFIRGALLGCVMSPVRLKAIVCAHNSRSIVLALTALKERCLTSSFLHACCFMYVINGHC